MRILVAEDDLTARTILVGILKKWGSEVVAVKDGQAAWEVLQQPDSPRLVILDWMMPGLDGLEVIRRARVQFVEQPPYIILLTSKDEKSDIISGLEAGANDYVRKPFNNEELFARIRVGQRTLELQTHLFTTQQTLAYLAARDPLTGIWNRRAIFDHFAKELARARREEHLIPSSDLSVGFIDIDHFKQINDQFGHQTGDEVLVGIAQTLQSNLRPYDSFGRIGGDEFLVVAPGSSRENCQQLFTRILTAIAAWKLTRAAGEVSVTVSIGVTSVNAEKSLDELLETVDSAMYRAKREGGNRVVYVD
jgi:two-component system, cell cycle response regulator